MKYIAATVIATATTFGRSAAASSTTKSGKTGSCHALQEVSRLNSNHCVLWKAAQLVHWKFAHQEQTCLRACLGTNGRQRGRMTMVVSTPSLARLVYIILSLVNVIQ